MIQNLDNVDIITKEKQAKSTTCTVDGASTDTVITGDNTVIGTTTTIENFNNSRSYGKQERKATTK